MKRIILVLSGIFLALISYSQKTPIELETNVSEFYVDTLYSQIDYCYSNTTNKTYILWFEKDNVDSLSNTDKIRKHFFAQNGDFSLIQLIWDGNVESFTPGLFESFFKIIKPSDQFTVSFIKEGQMMNNPDTINLLENHVVIVNAKEIKGLIIDNPINMFNYKAKNITIFENWLKIKK